MRVKYDVMVKEFARVLEKKGFCAEDAENADYESLLLRAGCLCGLWKSSFADTVVFPSGDEDWALLELGARDSGSPVMQQEIDRPLSKEEQSVAFQ